MTKRIARYASVLDALNKVNATTRNRIVASSKKDLVLALVDCAKAIINRRVPMTDAQLRIVTRLASDIRYLVNPRTPLRERRRVLQKGGFIGALLGPVLKTLLPTLLGGILGGTRR